jgi:hypothetical protein
MAAKGALRAEYDPRDRDDMGFDENSRQTRGAMEKSDAEYTAMWSLKRGGLAMSFVSPCCGVSQLRDKPPHPLPRTAERLPAGAV